MDYGLMDGPDVAPLDPLQAAKRNMYAYIHLIRPQLYYLKSGFSFCKEGGLFLVP